MLIGLCILLLSAWRIEDTISLDGENASFITFEASAGDVVTLTLTSDDDDPLANPVLAVLNPQNRLIAYNDNHFTNDPNLRATDSVIENLQLKQDGTYTVYVNTYGGIYAGDVRLTIETVDLFQITLDDADGMTTITGNLPASTPYHYTFDAVADDVLTITLRDVSGTLDPILAVMDADGNMLFQNDDHAGSDLTLNVFDAQLRDIVIPADGEYIIIARDFMGMSGEFALSIQR